MFQVCITEHYVVGLVLDAKEVHGMQHSTVIEFPGDSVKKAKFLGKEKNEEKENTLDE